MQAPSDNYTDASKVPTDATSYAPSSDAASKQTFGGNTVNDSVSSAKSGQIGPAGNEGTPKWQVVIKEMN